MLVLASTSPRRKELLAQAGFAFRVHPSSIPEELWPGEDPIAFATRLAREKAEAVFAAQAALDTPEDPLLVLGADTVVISPSKEVLASRKMRMRLLACYRSFPGIRMLW